MRQVYTRSSRSERYRKEVIQVKTKYDSLVEIPRGSSRVVHSPLHTRVPESLLLLLAADALKPLLPGRTFVVVTAHPNQMRAKLEALRIFRRRGRQLFNAASAIYVYGVDELDASDLPHVSLDKVLLLDCQSIPSDLAAALMRICTGDSVCAGHMTPKSHWFYTCQTDESIEVTADDTCEAYPDQVAAYDQAKADLSESEFARYYSLHDVEIEHLPVETFVARRLYIRTDRPVHLLNDRQRELADPSQSSNVVPFELTRLQRYYLEKKGDHKRVLLLKYRRGGLTTLEQAISYRTCVTRPHAQCVTLAHTFDSTKRIFRIAKMFHERDHRAPPTRGESQTQLEFPGLGSLFFIGTAGGRGFSRGDTLQRVHGSEVAWWCDGNVERVRNLLSGLTSAASHGEVVLETTPNGHEVFYELYQEALAGQNDYLPIFLPWFIDPINRLSIAVEQEEWTDEEIDLADRAYRQYGVKLDGFQVAFRRKMKREHKTLFPQEYPEDDITCFISSGTPFFDLDRVTVLYNAATDGKEEHVPGGIRTIFEEPQSNVKYVIGSDTSEGLSTGDPNGNCVMRQDNGHIVATVHGRFRPAILAKHNFAMSLKYNKALCGVERNNHGHAVISEMRSLNSLCKASQDEGGIMYYHSDGKAGWPTNSVTRPIMLNDLYEWMNDVDPEGVRDRQFLSECRTFKKQRNGKFEHDAKAHDDAVFKTGIANQMRFVNKRKPEIKEFA